ncbi:MAG: ABC transporter permease [Hyphomicrobiales bacterium]|nr:ABC transporter permease [Hyphomicrobiales bacterium]MBV8664522.1 ABC transporter permease [Hyphomicrobiales bacterium]
MKRKGAAPRRFAPWLMAIVGLVLFYLVFPILIVIPLSFSSASYLSFPPPGLSLQWYENFFGRSDWLSAARLSIWVGLTVTALATVLGTPAALGLVRGSFPGKTLINAFILSPLIAPTIIVAVGVYFFYARIGVVGSPLALILAHTALAVPFVVINVAATLQGFDEHLEYAAMNLGATPWRTFWQVTLPIIRPGVLAGAVFAFISSFDELIVALFVSGTGAVTLPRKMWQSIRFEIDPTIAAVSTILIALTAALFLGAELLRRRSERLRTQAPPA